MTDDEIFTALDVQLKNYEEHLLYLRSLNPNPVNISSKDIATTDPSIQNRKTLRMLLNENFISQYSGVNLAYDKLFSISLEESCVDDIF